jgi:phage shock protein E
MFNPLTRWSRPATAVPPSTSAADTVPLPATHAVSTKPVVPMLVIDVRSEREFEAAALDHALNLPLPQLVQRIGEIAPDLHAPLAVYCASGGRSGMACGLLKQLG